MSSRIVVTVGAVTICGLIYSSWVQHQRQVQLLAQLSKASPVAGNETPDNKELVTRIDKLEQRVRRVERQPVLRKLAAASPAKQEISDRRAPAKGGLDMHGADDSADTNGADITESAIMDLLESDNPVLQERLKEVIRLEQEQLVEERRERWQVRWIERTRKRLSQLAEQVGLSSEQEEWLSTAIEAERQQISEAFNEARRSGSFREARSEARQLRKATDEGAQAELQDKEQFEAYLEMREEDRSRRGPPVRRTPAND